MFIMVVLAVLCVFRNTMWDFGWQVSVSLWTLFGRAVDELDVLMVSGDILVLVGPVLISWRSREPGSPGLCRFSSFLVVVCLCRSCSPCEPFLASI
ncbi:hypothetical protein LDENG_00235750 [Lucifuga dentata]|nr:hypothetical protein LDENG_00235750 [Lucifuga dentata]